ncbi:MAG: hypothetical protein Q8L41_15555 [Anaerolineales bacterium]|nr:hypothetical protein [Anaerolineales bacterium]
MVLLNGSTLKAKNAPNKACTDEVGFCGTYGKHFSGFEFSLLPSRIHARPSAMLRERKPLARPLQIM